MSGETSTKGPPGRAKEARAATNEWDILGLDEAKVGKALLEADPRFKDYPDLAVNFIRGYSHLDDWQESAIDYGTKSMEWRKLVNADTITDPANEDKFLDGAAGRALYESMWQSGFIGEDGDGHPIILERVGQIPPKDFVQNYDDSEDGIWVRQCTFSKEVVRYLCRQQSQKHQKRIYKVVSIIDLNGLSFSHTGSKLLDLVKKYNSLFAWFYPETLKNLYIINAPMVFSAGWSVVKPWLDPITAAKISVISRESAVVELIAKKKLSMTRPDWATMTLSLKETLAEIREQNNGGFPEAFISDHDRQNIGLDDSVQDQANGQGVANGNGHSNGNGKKVRATLGRNNSTQTPPGLEWWSGPKYPLDKGRLQRRRQSVNLPFAKPFLIAWLVASTVRRQEEVSRMQRRAVMVWQNRALRALIGSRKSALSYVELNVTLMMVLLAIASSVVCWYFAENEH